MPDNIAHRGFRARFPENSMAAFRGALAAVDAGGGGAAALETDLHLTRDKVVVLSHDATLQRCFGRPERIADCDWAELATLRTAGAKGSEGEAGEPMARLAELLEYLAAPERAHVWVFLDIKVCPPALVLVLETACLFFFC